MRPTPQTDPTKSQSGGLFLTADGKNLFIIFALVTSLFLLWGFCNGMIDILNKHFQDSLHINKEQSGLVQSANYLAYFLMAIPAGLIARKFGYKGGILVGLTLIAAGAFWFIPAVSIGEYWAFLLGLFVIAAGMTCLETIANPYTTVLGPPENGATRINIAQTFNGVGWILGPVVGGQFVFAGGDGANANAGLATPYMGIGIFVAVLLVIFIVSKVPDLHAEDETRNPPNKKTASNLPAASLRASAWLLAIVFGLLYFFIAPILGLIWTLLNLPAGICFSRPNTACWWPATLPRFILVSKNWDMFRRKHFTLGIGAQFFYVAAQTGIFSFCVNYIIENDPGVTQIAGLRHAWRDRLCFVHVRTPLRQRGDQPVQAASRAGNLRGHQRRADCRVHGWRQAGYVCDVWHLLLHVRHVPDNFRARHPRTGRLHQARLVAHRHVHRGRGDCAAVHGPHRRRSMRTGMVVPLVCFVFIAAYGFVLAKAGGQGRGERWSPVMNCDRDQLSLRNFNKLNCIYQFGTTSSGVGTLSRIQHVTHLLPALPLWQFTKSKQKS